jgi:magnesium transporter
MVNYFKNYNKKVGLPPGSLTYIGPNREVASKITLYKYDEFDFEEKEVLFDATPFKPEKSKVLWLNVDGIHDVQAIDDFGKQFNLHSLTVEDILNSEQRPKVELGEEYLFVVLKMLHYNNLEDKIEDEQVSFILGLDYVLSFQEKQGDTFDSIRARLRAGKGKIRRKGADYLLYALMDTVVDNYYIILEKLGDKLERIEDKLLITANEKSLRELYTLKKEILIIRRSIWPLREVLIKMEREETSLIEEGTRIFIRDIYDHAIQVIDTIESYRDMLASMLDLYQSTLSNRINSVMKVLTIISTIFIPLTFIVGVYGMNFHFMPELEWKYGYLMVWIIMLLIAGIMIMYIRKKKWL